MDLKGKFIVGRGAVEAIDRQVRTPPVAAEAGASGWGLSGAEPFRSRIATDEDALPQTVERRTEHRSAGQEQ